jgi:hypothetical protein
MAAIAKSLIPQNLRDPEPLQPIVMPVSAPEPLPETPQPQVQLAPKVPTPLDQQIQHDQQKLQKIHMQQEPYQWNQHGAGRNIAHVLSVAGNIAGDIFAPSVMARIPGTQMNRQVEEDETNDRLSKEQEQQSQGALQQANTEHLNAETPEVAPNAASARRYQGAEADKLENDIAQGPSLATAYAHAVNQAIKNGADPSQDPIVQHLADAITGIQKESAPKSLMQSQPIIGQDGKPHTYLLDPQTGNQVKDLGVHYERPNVTNVNTGEKTWEYANNQLNTLGKPVADLTMRMGRLRDTLAQGTPQADALVAPELLTVMAGGQGSGLRMNEAEISRIVGGRSQWETLKAAMNKWSVDPTSANSITPAQRKQIHELVNVVNQKLSQKQSIINDAANRMVNIDDPHAQRQILAETRQALQGVDEGSAKETREYNGHTYEKGADGQWHLQQK